MDLDNEVFYWIERYLTGDMTPEEFSHFEMLLSNDASLKSKVERQRAFTGVLTEYGKRKSLLATLNKFHAELPLAELTNQYLPQDTKFYQLWKKHRVGLAVAASVLILAISGSMIFMNLLKMEGQSTQVRALKRDMEGIKNSQHVLISKLGHSSNTVPKSVNFGGTGFLIDSKGYLVTNFHVVDGSDSVSVESNNGMVYKTAVVYKNQGYDLAILQIKDSTYHSSGPLPYSFRRVQPELGEQVFTLGFPRDEIVYNEGYMSSATGYKGDTINYQLSIPVNPGNSGGPVLDNQGDILGIISGRQTQVDGVAFAIRSSYLVKALNDPKNDSIHHKITLPMRVKNTALVGIRRQQQVKKLQDFVFVVRAYN